MQNKSIIKKILYSLAGLVLLIAVSGWIFFTFYLEDTLNSYAIPKLQEAARTATHGRYGLTMGRITYSGGSFFCKDFILQRTGYDSSEHGNVIKRISIDSVRFVGVSWWDAIWGHDMRMGSVEMNTPKIYFANAEKELETQSALTPSPSPEVSGVESKKLPIISFDSIVLKDISIFLPERYHAGSLASFSDIQLKLTNFLLDSKTLAAQPLLYSERVDFSMAKASYPLDDSEYSIEFRNIRGSFSDSLLEIDSFAYSPKYSKQAIADRHRYVAPRLDLHCNNIHVRAINFVDLIAGTNVTFRSCIADTWSLDFYSDRRKPDDPHPPNAVLPNDLVRSIKIPVNVDSLILSSGNIHWGERWPGMEAGTLTFSHARIAISPFCTDSLNSRCTESTQIAVSALFLGEAKVTGVAVYALHDKAVNFDIDANVGPFSAVKLNTELIPIERLEVTGGGVNSGIIHMKVRDGFATTSVLPVYHDLKIKVLAKGAKESSGIMEWIKTFAANTFAIHGDNLATDKKKAITGVTSLKRKKDQEFMQFAWLAMKKSLGKVIGF
jgi:hypothetical protein